MSRGPKAIPAGAHSVLKELVRLMNEQRRSVASISDQSGLSISAIEGWLYSGRDPSLKNFDAAANSVGYELHIRSRRVGR